MLVVPTYNEKENIAELVKRIRLNSPLLPVLFVDDNSQDGTAAAVTDLQKHYEGIFLLQRPQKLGLASAYLTAFKKILQEAKSDFIVTMDGDLSHPPETLPEIIKLLKVYDVVVGSRYAKGGKIKNWNFWRRFVSFAGNLYARILTGAGIYDLTAGFVGYRVNVLRKLNLDRVRSEGYAFQIEIKTRLLQLGQKMHEHPIVFVERREGKSKLSFAIVLEGIIYPLKVLVKRILPWQPGYEIIEEE